ncbi:fimbria/pilus outer membrane usher protein [Escherichia coli]
MGYKYSTSGDHTFQEATDVRSDADSDYCRYHKRSQIQGNITQQLGDYGSVYFNMTQQDYWNVDGKENSLSAGYHGHIGRVNLQRGLYLDEKSGMGRRRSLVVIQCFHPSGGRVEQLSDDDRR